MLRDAVADRLRDRYERDGYLFPDYAEYSFANVPGTAAAVLDADVGRSLPADVLSGVDTDVENVVVLLVDGFGYDRWVETYRSIPFLDAVTSEGVVTPLTSIYPSETAAAITTVHTGATPAEHALLGWDLYLEEADVTLQPLPFRLPGGGDPVGVDGGDVDPELLFSGDPIYPRLRSAGVGSAAIQPSPTVGTPYSSRTLAGAQQVGWGNVADLGVKLRRHLERVDEPTYTFAYVPNIDAHAHRDGVRSEDVRAQLEMVFASLGRELGRVDPDVASDTLLLVTADHGLVDMPGEEQLDLREFDVVRENLRRGRDGNRIRPTGSPRSVHLHLAPGTAETVRDALDDALDAYVRTREQARAEGLFGDRGHGDRFDRRCGDVVLTHRSRQVWYGEDRRTFVAVHGGLTPAEMLVPFAAVNLAAVV